jgi:hypothetical protein
LDRIHHNPNGGPENDKYSATFTHPINENYQDTTELTPFRTNNAKDNFPYFKSQDVRGQLLGKFYCPTQIIYLSIKIDTGYTYPPITYENQKVDIQVPYDPDDRGIQKQYMGILQNYFGLKIKDIKENIKLLPRMFREVDKLEAPQGHEVLSGYRDFVFVVDLPEFKYSGSYRVDLCLATAPEVLVSSAAVFARSEWERCSACVEHQREDRPIIGHMPINPIIIAYLLDKVGKNREDTTKEEVITILQHSFAVKVLSPDGTQVLDEYNPEHSYENDEEKAKTVPAIRIVSSVVAEPKSQPRRGPGDGVPAGIEFFDANDHGYLFGRRL